MLDNVIIVSSLFTMLSILSRLRPSDTITLIVAMSLFALCTIMSKNSLTDRLVANCPTNHRKPDMFSVFPKPLPFGVFYPADGVPEAPPSTFRFWGVENFSGPDELDVEVDGL